MKDEPTDFLRLAKTALEGWGIGSENFETEEAGGVSRIVFKIRTSNLRGVEAALDLMAAECGFSRVIRMRSARLGLLFWKEGCGFVLFDVAIAHSGGSMPFDWMGRGWRFLSRVMFPPGLLIQDWNSEPLDHESFTAVFGEKFPCAGPPHEPRGRSGIETILKLVSGGTVLWHGSKRGVDAGSRSQRRTGVVRAEHRFRIYRPLQGSGMLIHEGTGWIKSCSEERAEREKELINFIGRALARCGEGRSAARRGKFVVLVGLDGAGKTTFSRGVGGRMGEGHGFRGFRYFHWIPKMLGIEFPMPALEEVPRKKPQSGTVAAGVSVVRLAKNVLVAWLAHVFRVMPLRRKGNLVMVDRFVYNYWIDPVSLKYSGPAWCLKWAGRLLPVPDMVISLEAEPEVLLARKRELTREQMEEMRARIRQIPVCDDRFHILDAAKKPEVLVDEFMSLLEEERNR